MLTGKQRSYLKSLAHNKKPMTQLGKDGLTDAFVDQISLLLDQHELIKIHVLDNSMQSAEAVAIEVCEILNAEYVQVIGNKFTIYRQSRTNPMIEIPGADNTRVIINKQKKAAIKKPAVTLSKRGGKISKPNAGKKSKAKAVVKEREEKALLEEKAAKTARYLSDRRSAFKKSNKEVS